MSQKIFLRIGAIVLFAGGAGAADTDHLDRVQVALDRGETVACAGCDLSGANLSLRDLTGADLAGANLANADLSGARLVGANLKDSRLIGANLISADFADADLTGANLSRAFIRATRFCATIMSDGRRDDSGC